MTQREFEIEALLSTFRAQSLAEKAGQAVIAGRHEWLIASIDKRGRFANKAALRFLGLPNSFQESSDIVSSPQQSVGDLGSSERFFSRIGAVRRFVDYLRSTAASLSSHDKLYVICPPRGLSLARLVGLLLLSRFFSKKALLDFRLLVGPSLLENKSWLFKMVSSFADCVLVTERHQQRLFEVYGYRAKLLSPTPSLAHVSARIVKTVQPLILMIADLELIHNHLTALRAFKLVKQKYPRAEMVIVGRGSMVRFLQNFIAAEHIYGVGLRSDASTAERAALYQKADLYLNTSNLEHCSAVQLEAMAAGLPTVSTPMGYADLFSNRQSILYVRNNDYSAVADRVLELIEKPELAETLSRNGSAAVSRAINDAKEKIQAFLAGF